MKQGIATISEVLKAESEEIVLRRKKAGLSFRLRAKTTKNGRKTNGKKETTSIDSQTSRSDQTPPDLNEQVQSNGSHKRPREEPPTQMPTVGLSLSGGGIRSGSVCLGFIQSLYRHGIMRHVDYLSTVSGGGYAGAFFSSLVMDNRTPDINWTPERPSSQHKTLDIVPDAAGRQPQTLAPIVFGGEKLNDPLPFANRWFLGALLLNLCIFSGLVAAAAFSALAYRSLDTQFGRLALKEIGIVSDTGRCFFPPMLAFTGWLLSTALAKWSTRIAKLRTPLFAILCVTLAMSFAVYIATADVSSPVLERGMAAPSEWRQKVSRWTDSLGTYLLVALVGALLPYLNPKRLLQSGSPRSNAIERWSFAIASRALLYGVPLFLFGYLAKEDIARTQVRTQSTMHALHMDKFDAFWERVWLESCKNDPLSVFVWNEVERALTKDSAHVAKADEQEPTPEAKNVEADSKNSDSTTFDKTLIGQTVLEYKRINEPDQHFLNNLSRFGLAIFPPSWPKMVSNYRERVREIENRQKVAQGMTDLLKAKDLSLSIKDVPSTSGDKPSESTVIANANHFDPKELANWVAVPRNLPKGVSKNDSTAKRLSEERTRANWGILQAHYGPVIRPANTIFAAVVIPSDQKFRLWVGGISLGILIATGLLIDLNAISLHGYYRQKLGELWINELPKWGYRIPIHELKTTHKGAPYHLINGTLNLMHRGSNLARCGTARFTFSQRYCGARRVGYARTDTYVEGSFDLADAIGISSAAVNAAHQQNPLARVLLLILNFRLGQWVPNPAHASIGSWWAAPIRLFVNWVRFGEPENRPYCFVTDGGHDENTGIGALLERRCRIIIAVDATHDPKYEFIDLLKVVRVAAAEHGVRILDLVDESKALNLDQLKPAKRKRFAHSHFLVARIKYPADNSNSGLPMFEQEGYLILVKPNLTGDEPTELLHYRKENRFFPHDPTLDQFFDPRRFACYRQLGEHLGDKLCEEFLGKDNGDRPGQGAWLANNWLPPSERQKFTPPYVFHERSISELLSGLSSEDGPTRANAFTIVAETFEAGALSRDLSRQVINTLIARFKKAHRQSDVCVQTDMCKFISFLGADIFEGREFLEQVADGTLKTGTDHPIPVEIRQQAKECLAKDGAKQDPTAAS